MNSTHRQPPPAGARPAAHTPHAALACLCLAVSLSTVSTGIAHASTPQEKVVCTQTPRSQWMSERQARKLFKADDYALVKFKVSKGNCHEFYAVDPQGDVVEAYMHPVTGAQIRITRIPAPNPSTSNPSGVRP